MTTSLLDRSQLTNGELMAHQATAVDWLLDRKRAVLADDAGLGKTVTIAGLVSALAERSELTGTGCRVVYLTEASLLRQTTEELRRFLPDLGIESTDSPALRSNAAKKAQEAYRARYGTDGPDVLVASYSTATSRLRADSILLPAFEELRPALVVFDEASVINGGGEHFRTCLRLSRLNERVVAMTATPIENHPMETYNLLQAVGLPGLWDKRIFERDFVVWQESYLLPSGQTVPRKPINFRPDKLAEVHAYLGAHTLRRTAATAGLTLPERVGDRLVWVKPGKGHTAAYGAAQRFEGKYGYHLRTMAGRIADNGSSALVAAALKWLDVRSDVDKAVLYAENMAVLEDAEARLPDAGIGFVRIDGKASKAQRAEAVTRFRDDGSCRILLGSSVLERGLNLQFCRVMLSLGPSDNPAREWQRERRICRIGSPHGTYEHVTFALDLPIERERVERLHRKVTLGRSVFAA